MTLVLSPSSALPNHDSGCTTATTLTLTSAVTAFTVRRSCYAVNYRTTERRRSLVTVHSGARRFSMKRGVVLSPRQRKLLFATPRTAKWSRADWAVLTVRSQPIAEHGGPVDFRVASKLPSP